ncbi:MAG: RNA-directed DNA polymerase [Alphaproteobacteria bacterium]|nr:RNA-directed DNA polymerase [Alphaproteobacteria bacterium]
MTISKGRKANFQRAIMEKGFYPENLPPVFSVQDFFSVSRSLGLFSGDQIERRKPLTLARYNETKRGGQRRIFSTPNPLFFIDIASYLGQYRAQLAPILRQSSFSRSIPQYDSNFHRALRIDSFSDFTALRRRMLATSRYIVKTDISRFFHSIYTHSIPWSVHGKLQSKKDRSWDSVATYANKLDYLVRQSQDQQTVGIPVGPDTSRIISELISGAIDVEFVERVDSDVSAIRLVDDVYIGASTAEEAQNLLSAYRDAIRQFELDINENKTRIFDAKQDLEPFWPVTIRREIQGFSESIGIRNQEADLVSYLDEIIRTANRENDDGIIKYAIRKMDDFKLWVTFWDCVEPFLIRMAINFPHCLDYVARVIVWMNRRYGIDTERWQEVCRAIISHHAPLGNDSEVVWSCWILKEIDGKLTSDLCDMIVRRCGPFPLIIMIDLVQLCGGASRMIRQLVGERLGDNPMVSGDWLVSYEAERIFGYRLKDKNRKDYGVFGDLLANGTQFYDPGANPVVFQGKHDLEDISEAIEDRGGLYDGLDEVNSGDLFLGQR